MRDDGQFARAIRRGRSAKCILRGIPRTSSETMACGLPSSHRMTQRASSGSAYGVLLSTVRGEDCTPNPAMYGFAPGAGVMSNFAVEI